MTYDVEKESLNLAAAAAAAFAAKEYSKTIELADKAFQLKPTLGRAYLAKSLALAQLGDPAGGLEIALRGIAENPEYALLYTAAAICAHRCGRTEDARRYFAQATALRPDHPQVLYNYACYWAEVGDEEKCRHYLTLSFANLKNESFLDEARNDPDLARFAHQDWFLNLIADVKRRRWREDKETP